MPRPLRIGILGAAPIAIAALIEPARQTAYVEIAAVAARDQARAEQFALRHRIPRVVGSYGALLVDPAIDAVYIPLPNSLHAPWGMRALQAGKHVLCEKPLALNAAEAAAFANVAAEHDRILFEAFHYRYHPLAARMKAVIDNGEIGTVRHIEAEFSVPLLDLRSIQYRAKLGGGATMDVGCYAINLIRFLAGAEPHVERARAKLVRPQVDRFMEADLRFDDGRTAHMVCALLSSRLLHATARVIGNKGELRVLFPFLPHHFHRLTIVRRGGARHEHVAGATTYTYQLRAFLDAVRSHTPAPTDGHDAVANMRVIDAIYNAAGLLPRA